jgi:hypothetical protein
VTLDPSCVERLPVGEEEAWLRALPRQQADVPGVHRVRELLPPGYDTYLRLFHPFLPSGSPDVPASHGAHRNTWLRLASEAGVTYHPELTWRSLLPALDTSTGQRLYETFEGDLEPITRGALFEQLAVRTTESVFYLFGLGAVVAGGADNPGPLLYRGAAGAIEKVREQARRDKAAVVPGPEYAWPKRRAWVLNSDYDLFVIHRLRWQARSRLTRRQTAGTASGHPRYSNRRRRRPP